MVSAISWALILLVFISVCIFAFQGKAGWFSGGPFSRPPTHRPKAVRLICGLCGVGILITTAAVSRKEAQIPYKIELENFTIETPTRPLDTSIFGEGGKNPIAQKPIQLKVHHILAESYAGSLFPTQIETMDIRWPEDRNKTVTNTYYWKKTKVQQEMKVREIKQIGETVHLYGRHKTKYRGPNFTGSRSGSIKSLDKLHVARHFKRFVFGGSGTHFSLVRNRQSNYWLLSYITATEEDWTTTPLTAFLEERQAKIDEEMQEQITGSGHPFKNEFSPAMSALAHFGGNTLYLFLAALLLTQLFKRRNLAFAGMMLIMVFFVFALEHSIYRLHQKHAANPEATRFEQVTAEARMDSMFFVEPEITDR